MPRAVEPLLRALKDPESDVRKQVAWALGAIRDARAVDGLIAALGDTHGAVRKQVAWALGAIGDGRATDGLTAALQDKDADVRKQAAWALGVVVRRQCEARRERRAVAGTQQPQSRPSCHSTKL